MAFTCRRSFESLALLASSSRLRAPKTSRALTTLPGARSKPSEGRQHAPSVAPISEHLEKYSESTHTDDHSSAPHQQTFSSPPSEGERLLLESFELFRRVILLCERGDVDLAITALQEAPLDAQNIKVWNRIIKGCMEAKKYNLAYSVFTDLKRRGFIPNVRTYSAMMSGYAAIDDWRPFTKQLEFVQSIYEQLKQRLEETHDSIDDPDVQSYASYIQYSLALYISILGKAGKYQKAFDAFHELDTDGPLAPHPKIYSAILLVLSDRTTIDAEDPKAIEKLVSDAKDIWRRQKRSLDRQPENNMVMGSVYAMIKILSCSSQPSDHELMYDILRDTCGLPRLGENEKEDRPPPSQTVSPTKWILQVTLDSCIAVHRPDLVVHYAQSVMDSPKLRPILWAGHLSKLLRAHILLAKKEERSPSSSRSENAAEWVEWMVAKAPREKLMPNPSTIALALELCHRCQDLPSAIRITRMILNSDVDSEGLPRGRSGFLLPKAWENLFALARVASPDEKRQCLQLFDTHGGSVLDIWKSTSAVRGLEPSEKKAYVFIALHIVKMLRPVPFPPDHDAAELQAWFDIQYRAELFLKENPAKKTGRYTKKKGSS